MQASTAARSNDATIIGPDEFSVTYGIATSKAKENGPASPLAFSSHTLFGLRNVSVGYM